MTPPAGQEPALRLASASGRWVLFATVRICGARRCAVPAAGPARAGLRLHGPPGGHLAAAGNRDHAAAIGALRRAGGTDRPSPPVDGRPDRDRRRPGTLRQDRALGQLLHGRAAWRPGLRLRPRDQRRTAYRDRPRCGADPKRGSGIRRQQRRGQGCWPHRRGRAACCRRPDRVRVPARRCVLLRLQDGIVHLGGPVRARRRPSCRHNPEPAPGSQGTGRAGSRHRGAAGPQPLLHCGLDSPPPRPAQFTS